MAGTYDYSSPFAAASLIAPDGQRIPLWTNTSRTGKPTEQAAAILQRAGVYSLPFATSISISMDLSNVPTITVRLEPPYEVAVAILDSPFVEWGQSQIEVQFGYTGGTAGQTLLSPVFKGITAQPSISMGDDITIELKALGSLAVAAGERNFAMNACTRLEIIEKAVRGVETGGGRKLELDTSEALQDPVSAKLLNERIATFSSNSRTDWDIVNLVANQCLCWPFTIGDTVRLLPRSLRLSGPAKRIFSMREFPGGRVGPQAGVFPILSFSTDTQGIYMGGVIKAISNAGISSDGREEQRNFYDHSSVRPTVVGAGNANPKASELMPGIANDETKDGAAHVFGDVNAPTTEALLKSQFEGLTSNIGVKIDIGTIGMPDILPGDVIALRGLGKRLCEGGNYGVFQVQHTFDSGGFATNLSCWSNTSKIGNADPTAKDPNTKVAAEGSDKLATQPKTQS